MQPTTTRPKTGMLEGIDKFCPILSERFHEGCMGGVTREELEEYALQCPTLALDWGPFFDDDQEDEARSAWQRGRNHIGNKYVEGNGRGGGETKTKRPGRESRGRRRLGASVSGLNEARKRRRLQLKREANR